MIILRQRARVTHVVQVLDDTLYKDLTAKESTLSEKFSLYRIVKAIWITDDWDNLLTYEQVFGQKIVFPRSGKVLNLENIGVFQEI